MDFTETNLPKPLAQLYEYWKQKRGDRVMPSRADIDPVEMRAFLPHTMLLDVLSDPSGEPKFRVRLVGTHVVKGYGSDFTGKYIQDIDLGDQRGKLLEACLFNVNCKKPAYISGSLVRSETNETISYARLGVPLSGDGDVVDIILIGAVVVPRKVR